MAKEKQEAVLSGNMRKLERAFDLLNQAFFESALSKAVITVQSSPKTYGHCSSAPVWSDKKQGAERYEINVSAEHLTRPIQNIMATLLHEMVHQYCAENGIKDTSRSGTYHNKRFKKEAEQRGLVISYETKIGWSVTEPDKKLLEFLEINSIVNDFEVTRKTFATSGNPKKKSSTRKYVCPGCGQSVRATKEVNILCGDCNEVMECAEAADTSEAAA